MKNIFIFLSLLMIILSSCVSNPQNDNVKNVKFEIKSNTVKVEADKVINYTLTETKTLTVDYSQTIHQMLCAGGYYFVNQDIAEGKIPIPIELVGTKVEISTVFFCFNKEMSSEEVILKIDEAGYRPATLFELMALRIEFPGLHKQSIILALGSVWHRFLGQHYAQGLNDYYGRSLYRLCFYGGRTDWYSAPAVIFLAVRK